MRRQGEELRAEKLRPLSHFPAIEMCSSKRNETTSSHKRNYRRGVDSTLWRSDCQVHGRMSG